jgi:F1F0 ATPase subunit 2
MNDLFRLTVAFGFGSGLGLLYFGGLWWTVRRIAQANRPKLLLVASFLTRTMVVLTGFYGLIQGMGAQWEALALSLLGFIAVRFALVHRWGPEVASSSSPDSLANL